MNQKEKSRSRAKEWYKKNRDKALLRVKIASASVKAREDKRNYDQNYRTKNKDKISQRIHSWYLAHKGLIKERAKVWKQKNQERAQYLRYIERAKQKDSSFGLTFDLFLEVIKMPCVYCGFNDGIVGIDRIDSKKGYEEDNIVPCCKVCNYMKLDHTIDDWFAAMRDVFEYQGYVITPSTKKDSTR